MLLISLKLEHSKKIIKEINKYNKDIRFQVFLENDLKNSIKFPSVDVVVTEYSKKKIDYFIKENKKIIIYNTDDVIIDKKYVTNEKIFSCKNVEELMNLLNEKEIKEIRFPKRLIPISITTILLIIGFIILGTNNLSNKEKQEAQKPVEKEELVEKVIPSKYKRENYLFLGDSITDFYDLKKFYGDLPVVNSGRSGEQTSGLLDNLETRVFRYNPTKIFLLIGTNDIAFTEINNEDLVDRIIEICDDIHKVRKNAEIYVESIYPVNRNDKGNDVVDIGMVGGRHNERIKEINTLLKAEVEKKNYKYIDMYKLLEDENGDLVLEYTKDGLHMSEQGYEVITSQIKKIIYNE